MPPKWWRACWARSRRPRWSITTRKCTGPIPIPATLSLELARIINSEQPDTNYRFISDYPFKSRKPHALDQFEVDVLARLRADPKQVITDVSWSNLTNTVRLVSPVLMGGACVACHNSHVESAKKDWKVGDVRGIQEIIVVQPLFSNIFVFNGDYSIDPFRRRILPSLRKHCVRAYLLTDPIKTQYEDFLLTGCPALPRCMARNR